MYIPGTIYRRGYDLKELDIYEKTLIDASRRGNEVLNPFRHQNARHVLPAVVEGVREPTRICDPGSELRLGGSRTRRAKLISRMELNIYILKKKTRRSIASHGHTINDTIISFRPDAIPSIIVAPAVTMYQPILHEKYLVVVTTININRT